WGRETTVPWAIRFCNARIEQMYGFCPAGNEPRHPSQLYEAGLEGLLLLIILSLAIWKWKMLKRPGFVTGLFLLGYGVCRAALENVRQPDAGLEHLPLGLTMGMILSIPMMLVGAWLIWRALKKPVVAEAEAVMTETLKDRLVREIALTGPMTVADYGTRCLHDPRGGYYSTRPALGEGGDFITAPLVSQMFGELIGLWAIEVWSRLGAPERVRLVEVGPGDGTLMSDVLRAARLVPGFLQAADLILIEPSGPLRAEQARRLAD